ncbi:choice-of-anchor A family protein [bacterium]|nr:choice-of-anchor A family protein [bacterium]
MSCNFTRKSRSTNHRSKPFSLLALLFLGISLFSNLEVSAESNINNNTRSGGANPNSTKSVLSNPRLLNSGSLQVGAVFFDEVDYFENNISLKLPVCALAVVPQVTDETCKANNGAITLNVTGATNPVHYTWTGPGAFISTSKDIQNLKPGNYTVIATDASGCVATSTVTVNRIYDLTAPTLDLYTYVEVALPDTSDFYVFGNGDLIYSAYDNCDYTVSYSPAYFNCNDVGKSDSVYVTLTDAFGNFTTKGTVVKVLDITPPAVHFYHPVVLQLDENGSAKLFASNVDSLSYDRCGRVAMTLSKTSFSCSDLPSVDITVTAVDESGNSESDTYTRVVSGKTITYVKNERDDQYTVTISVDDCLPPVAICKDITVNLGSSGYASILPEDVDDGSFDNCNLWYFTLEDCTFDCHDAGLGQRTVNMHAYDYTGNMACCPVKVTVLKDPMTASVATTSSGCGGLSMGAACATVVNGCEPITYTWSNGDSTSCIDSLAAGTYTVTITDANNETITKTFIIDQGADFDVVSSVTQINCYGAHNGAIDLEIPGVSANCGGFTTFTQGGWGTACKGSNPGCYRDANFTAAFPSGLTIGCASGFQATFNSSAAVKNFLPAGGTANKLTSNYTNPTSSSAGVLAGQLVALTLNVTFDGYDPAFGASSGHLADNKIAITGSPFYGMSVADFLVLANEFIGGCPSPYSASDFNTVATAINENYDNGTVNRGNLTSGTFTYNWSNGASTQDVSNLAPGVYTVEITDCSGCSRILSFEITQPAPLSTTLSITNVSCFGGNNGSASATVSGGTAPYTYQWSTGATGTAISNQKAGIYTFSVTDANGCTRTDSVEITEPTAISVSTHSVDATCASGTNGKASVAANGGTAPYTYLWSNGATADSIQNLSPGNYSVTVTDANGCEALGSVVVSRPACCNVTSGGSIANAQEDCNPFDPSTITSTVSAAGGLGTVEYQWYQSVVNSPYTDGNPNWSAISGATSETYNPGLVSQTTYFVRLARSAGCSDYAGVSNIIAMTIKTPPTVDVTQVDGNCSSELFEAALGFNVFVKNNVTLSTNETEGAIAMGGNLTLNGSYTVAGHTAGTFKDAGDANASALVIGGSIYYTSGSGINVVNNGFVKLCNTTGSNIYDWDVMNNHAMNTRIAAGSMNSNPRINLSVYQSATSVNKCPIDFSNAFGRLENTALSLAACSNNISLLPADANNPSASPDRKRIQLAANTKNVLNITWNDLAALSEITFNNQPSATSTLIVNVNNTGSGSATWSVPNFAGIGDQHGQYIIWNFYNTTSLTLTGGGTLKGTLLAPLADVVDNNSGNIDGQLIAKSFVHNGGEMHNYLFNANVLGCNSSCTSEITNNEVVICSGSTTTLKASGGGTYSWSNGAHTQQIEVGAGIYTVTVTGSNGCTATKTISVIESPAMTIAGNVTNATCTGSTNGSINVSTTGGTAPLTYKWSNGATTKDLSNIGSGTYTVVVTDAVGCTASKTFTVEDKDLTAPVARCKSITVELDEHGMASIDASTIDNGSTDNCGIASITVTPSSFDCSKLGANTVTLTVTDNSGNVSTCTSTVTVVDRIEPQVLCMNITVPLNANGTASINYTNIDFGSTDNCGIASRVLSKSTFTCADLGMVTVNYTVTDGSGNSATCQSTVNVIDPIAPTITNVPNDITVTATSDNCNPVVSWTPPTAHDNCSVVMTSNYHPGDHFGPGVTTVIYTATDAQGNLTTASFNVTIIKTALTVVQSVNHVKCHGSATGSASVTVSGGCKPYSYLWSTGATTSSISGLAAGTYTLTITDDSGETKTVNITITEPDALAATAEVQDVSCGNTSCDCSEGIASIKVKFTGNDGSTIVVKDEDGDEIKTYENVDNGDIIEVDASNISSGSFGNSIKMCIAQNGGTRYGNNYAYHCTPRVNAYFSDDNKSVTCGSTKDLSNVVLKFKDGSTYKFDGLSGYSQTFSGTGSYQGKEIVGVYIKSGCNQSGDGPGYGEYVGNANGYHEVNLSTICGSDLVGRTSGSFKIVSFEDVDGNTCNYVGPIQPCDGHINLSVSGGVAPYTFNWSNNSHSEDLGALCAGTYSVTITDANGCTITKQYTVSTPTCCNVTDGGSIADNQSNCGSFDPSEITNIDGASGGSGSLEYAWAYSTSSSMYLGNTNAWTIITGATSESYNPGVLSQTTYFVRLAKRGSCTEWAGVSNAVTIEVKPVPSATATNLKNVNCYDDDNGAATIAVTGGTGTYTYIWSNGNSGTSAQNLTAGNYTVVVEDANGCSTTATFTITQPDELDITADGTFTVCSGSNNGSINVTVSGGTSSYSYAWTKDGNSYATSEDLTNLSSGQYVLEVTDANGCTATLSQKIKAEDAFDVAGTVTNVSCYGGNNGAIDLNINGGSSSGAGSNVWDEDFSDNNESSTCDYGHTSWSRWKNNYNNRCEVKSRNNRKHFEMCNGDAEWRSENIDIHNLSNCHIEVNLGSCQGNYLESTGTYADYVKTYYRVNGGSWKLFDNNHTTYGEISGSRTASCDNVNGSNLEIKVCAHSTASDEYYYVENVKVTCGSGSTSSSSYTYSWSNGAHTQNISNLEAGTYTVTITNEGGCSITKTFTVGEPNELVVEADVYDVSCSGNTHSDETVQDNNNSDQNSNYDYYCNKSNHKYCHHEGGGKYSGCSHDNDHESDYRYTCSKEHHDNCHHYGGGRSGQDGGSSYDDSDRGCKTDDKTNTPSYSCECNGKMKNFTVKYLGSGGVNVYAYNMDKSSVIKTFYNVNSGDLLTVEGFDFKGRLDAKTYLKIGGSYTYNEVHTSCSINIMGMIIGDFQVVSYTDGEGNYCDGGVSVDQTCDGAIDLNISGGKAPYTVSWSNGETGETVNELCAGDYTVVVTDANGCTKTLNVTVGESSCCNVTLGGVISANQTSCYAFDADVLNNTKPASGGSGTLEYVWYYSTTDSTFTYGESTWTLIEGANESSYDPGTISTTTYFVRLAKRHTCPDWAGVSNVVTIEVGNGPTASISLISGGTCAGGDAKLKGMIDGDYSSYYWKYNGSALSTNGSVTVQVDSDNDDAEELLNSGIVRLNSSDLELGNDDSYCNGSDQLVGLRFTGLNIPQGATIKSAYIKFKSNDYNSRSTYLSIKAHDVDNASSFSSSYNNLSNRSTTSNSVSWNVPTWYTNYYYYTPDISSVVEEVVNRSGWSSGNSLAILISGSGYRSAYSHDYYPAKAPELIVEYELPHNTLDIDHAEFGTYELVVSNSNGCTYTASYTISQPDPISISGTTTNTAYSYCNGSINVSVSGGKAPYVYSWSNGSSHEDPCNLCSGNYTLTVIDANGCSATKTFYVGKDGDHCDLAKSDKPLVGSATGATYTVGTEESENLNLASIVVYPNPASQITKVSYVVNNTANVHVYISDLTGKTLIEIHNGEVSGQVENSNQVDINDLRSGVYMVVVEGANNERLVERLVVSR